MSAAPHDSSFDGASFDGGTFDGGKFDGTFADGHDFPSESEWLDLPMPALPEGPQAPAADEQSGVEQRGDDFVSRVLRAREEEQQLDAELARLDGELPHSLLQQFATPPISDDFVDTAVAAIQRDRQQRWRALMARYVAPEPSPEFVDRTLQALFDGAQADGSSVQGTELDGAPFADIAAAARRGASAPLGPPPPLAPSAAGPRQLPWQAAPDRSAGRPTRAARWAWGIAVAAAAAAVVLLSWPTSSRAPFELRVAETTPAERAWADAVSPLPTMLAAVAAAEEPDGLFDAPVSALWLAAAAEAPR